MESERRWKKEREKLTWNKAEKWKAKQKGLESRKGRGDGGDRKEGR